MELRPPLTLVGRQIRLIPMEIGHAEALARAGNEPEIWRFLPYGPCTNAASMAELIDTLLSRQAAGTDLAFTVVSADGTPVGMTRYLEIDRVHRRLEIGGTWYASAFRGTTTNTEAKLLLLRHAFEAEGANRVQFKTDLRNLRSQRAIERLGAVREGVLRDHVVMPDGYLRSSVLYSIVAPEWPAVRDRLLARLATSLSAVDNAPTRAGRPESASPGTR